MNQIKGIYQASGNYLVLVALHVVIGFVLFRFEPLAKIYFTALMVFFIWRITTAAPSKKTQQVLIACAYFAGAEVLFRMTKGGLAYEASKYLVILFMMMGMFFKGVSGKSYPYFIYLILLVPAVIVASMTLRYDANFRTNVAFVLSGPVCLGIAALFCYNRKITQKQLLDVIMYLSLPIIALTTYLYFYNPSIEAVLSGTDSNYQASGGFGPNQVSTVLGLGMFAMTVNYFLRSPLMLIKILNLVILGAMTYRAIVTFSRGGVYAAIIVIAGFLWILFMKSSFNKKGHILISLGLLIMVSFFTWSVSSKNTYGLIDKRYANQNASGQEKSDITTGRVSLFMDEVDGFLKSPFLGIGASRVKDARIEERNAVIASHNEIGRTLSEHGFLGVVVIVILIVKPLAYRTTNRGNIYFYAFLFFWFATINHSGMRIAAPAFLYAMALLNVTNENNSLRRKQLAK